MSNSMLERAAQFEGREPVNPVLDNASLFMLVMEAHWVGRAPDRPTPPAGDVKSRAVRPVRVLHSVGTLPETLDFSNEMALRPVIVENPTGSTTGLEATRDFIDSWVKDVIEDHAEGNVPKTWLWSRSRTLILVRDAKAVRLEASTSVAPVIFQLNVVRESNLLSCATTSAKSAGISKYPKLIDATLFAAHTTPYQSQKGISGSHPWGRKEGTRLYVRSNILAVSRKPAGCVAGTVVKVGVAGDEGNAGVQNRPTQVKQQSAVQEAQDSPRAAEQIPSPQ
jgi:hypothetical protein